MLPVQVSNPQQTSNTAVTFCTRFLRGPGVTLCFSFEGQETADEPNLSGRGGIIDCHRKVLSPTVCHNASLSNGDISTVVSNIISPNVHVEPWCVDTCFVLQAIAIQDSGVRGWAWSHDGYMGMASSTLHSMSRNTKGQNSMLKWIIFVRSLLWLPAAPLPLKMSCLDLVRQQWTMGTSLPSNLQ